MNSNNSKLPSGLWGTLPLAALGLLFILGKANADAVHRCKDTIPSTTVVHIFREKCYHFISEEKYWTSARDFCMRHGGSLVKNNDEETNRFLTSALNQITTWYNEGVWIGLNDRNVELRWEWTNGGKGPDEAVSWTNWASGHPALLLHSKRDCVRMKRDEGKWTWVDTPCEMLRWHYRFICEYDALVPSMTPATVAPPTLELRTPTVMASSTVNEENSTGQYFLEAPRQTTLSEHAGQLMLGDEAMGSQGEVQPAAMKSSTTTNAEGTYLILFGGIGLLAMAVATAVALVVYNMFGKKQQKTPCRSGTGRTSCVLHHHPNNVTCAERAIQNPYINLEMYALHKQPLIGSGEAKCSPAIVIGPEPMIRPHEGGYCPMNGPVNWNYCGYLPMGSRNMSVDGTEDVVATAGRDVTQSQDIYLQPRDCEGRYDGHDITGYDVPSSQGTSVYQNAECGTSVYQNAKYDTDCDELAGKHVESSNQQRGKISTKQMLEYAVPNQLIQYFDINEAEASNGRHLYESLDDIDLKIVS